MAIDAVADERVEDVGDGDDPPGERDRLTRKPARVAVTVEPLVVCPGDLGSELEQRLARAGEDAVAELRVGLDDEALLGAERRRLAQDVVGDRDLADVVQRARDPDQVALVVREPEPPRDQLAAAADALDVLPGLVVAELRRGREAVDRLLTRPAELGRPLGDELLEPDVMSPVLDLQAAPPQRVGDPDVDLAVPERLDDVAVRSERERRLRKLRIVGATDHHHGHIRAAADDVVDELQPGLARQVHVAEDDLERPCGQLSTCFRGVPDDGRQVAFARDQPPERLAHGRVVVNDEDSRQLPSQPVRAFGRGAHEQRLPGRRV